jgi:hypothetical protein
VMFNKDIMLGLLIASTDAQVTDVQHKCTPYSIWWFMWVVRTPNSGIGNHLAAYSSRSADLSSYKHWAPHEPDQ